MTLVALAFALGASPARWWTIVILPALSLAAGASSVGSEPQNYDMHGAGFYLGLVVAAIAAIAWLAGRVARWLITASPPPE